VTEQVLDAAHPPTGDGGLEAAGLANRFAGDEAPAVAVVGNTIPVVVHTRDPVALRLVAPELRAESQLASVRNAGVDDRHPHARAGREIPCRFRSEEMQPPLIGERLSPRPRRGEVGIVREKRRLGDGVRLAVFHHAIATGLSTEVGNVPPGGDGEHVHAAGVGQRPGGRGAPGAIRAAATCGGQAIGPWCPAGQQRARRDGAESGADVLRRRAAHDRAPASRGQFDDHLPGDGVQRRYTARVKTGAARQGGAGGKHAADAEHACRSQEAMARHAPSRLTVAGLTLHKTTRHAALSRKNPPFPPSPLPARHHDRHPGPRTALAQTRSALRAAPPHGVQPRLRLGPHNGSDRRVQGTAPSTTVS
jgi:hypothetical protein